MRLKMRGSAISQSMIMCRGKIRLIRTCRLSDLAKAIDRRFAIACRLTGARSPPLWLDPAKIPPEVQVKASLPTNTGRPSLSGPGRLESVDLNPSEIATVEVFKGDSAVLAYGADARNGVVVITTKRGAAKQN